MGEILDGRPLTADLLKSALSAPGVRLGRLERYFKAVLKGLQKEIQAFHTTPVKCSIASVSVETLTPQGQAGNTYRFASTGEELRIWFDSDREFDMLLCELCLGGTGVASDPSDSERPASKFEKRLKSAVADLIVASLPEAARLAHGASWIQAGPPPEDAVLQEPKSETCVCLKVLVNAFALGGEFSVLFHQTELEHALHLAAFDETPSQVMVRPALEACLFELQVYLKPQLIGLDKILNMQPGQLIPLNSTVASPVSVHFEDAHIFDARINLNNDAINVELAQMQPAEAAS